MTTNASAALIGLDWGTSSLRAYLFDASGRVLAETRAARGVMQVRDGDFAGALEEVAGTWRRDWPMAPMIAAGMIGSAQGWVEAPYAPCPAAPTDLAGRLVAVPEAGLWIVPGVMLGGPAPNVMRGEEAQVVGALALRPELGAGARLVLPGTHSKWVEVARGGIARFATYMTGELFAVLRGHSILGRFTGEAEPDAARDAFLRGVDAGRAGSGLAPLLFSARTLVLTGALAPEQSGEYLSGLLIGDEIRAAAPGAEEPLLLIGDPALSARYMLALTRFETGPVSMLGEATPAGLFTVAREAGLLSGKGNA